MSGKNTSSFSRAQSTKFLRLIATFEDIKVMMNDSLVEYNYAHIFMIVKLNIIRPHRKRSKIK